MSKKSTEDDAHKRYLKRRSLVGLALKRAIKDKGLYNESLCAMLGIIADVRADALQEAVEKGKAEWFRDTATITWSRIERAILGADA